MSINAKALQRLYNYGKITENGLLKAITDGIITEEEYNIIVSKKVSLNGL